MYPHAKINFCVRSRFKKFISWRFCCTAWLVTTWSWRALPATPPRGWSSPAAKTPPSGSGTSEKAYTAFQFSRWDAGSRLVYTYLKSFPCAKFSKRRGEISQVIMLNLFLITNKSYYINFHHKLYAFRTYIISLKFM